MPFGWLLLPMHGYLSLVLHSDLPSVRHPQHERFLEESWLFEAITESYIPLLQLLQKWEEDGLNVRLTLTLTPTLCSMLQDPLLQDRYLQRLEQIIGLVKKELHRTRGEQELQKPASFSHTRLIGVRDWYRDRNGDLVGAFSEFQHHGRIEIVTSAATHALLPMLAAHRPSLTAQIRIACEHYRSCFAVEPRGIWLPECAWFEGLDVVLAEAGLRWFITDTHGILNARPQPRYAVFAPVLTPAGVAAFGRDPESAHQVWSRDRGYPGDPRYRDFYRDIGFDLDVAYVEPHLPAPGQRGFTGIKYYRITNSSAEKHLYSRDLALKAAEEHAAHFMQERKAQISKLNGTIDRAPVLICPYDAELFGHWWYEGPEFLDALFRKVCQPGQLLSLITPNDYLCRHPRLQAATPAASSWGEQGYWGVWLNEQNEWIYPHLSQAQERMTQLANTWKNPTALQERALRQAGRELLLAQASDWPFIIRTGTSPEYARKQVTDRLLRFTNLFHQISGNCINEQFLKNIEDEDNVFPNLDYRYWAEPGAGDISAEEEV